MNDQKPKVMFRRIGGRIVPIKVDPEAVIQREMAATKKSGGRLIAGGLLGTALAAEAGGRLGLAGKIELSKARAYTERAIKFSATNMQFSNAAVMRAAKHLKKGRRLITGAKVFGGAAGLVGTGIIAEGVARRMFPDGNRDANKQAWASTLIGIPLYYGVTKIIKKRAFPFLK